MRLRVDPRKVTVVEMRDGTRYRPGRNGTVNLRPEHADEVARFGRPDAGETGFLGPSLGRLDLPGRACPTCGRDFWSWQTVCPRDGSAL